MLWGCHGLSTSRSEFSNIETVYGTTSWRRMEGMRCALGVVIPLARPRDTGRWRGRCGRRVRGLRPRDLPPGHRHALASNTFLPHAGPKADELLGWYWHCRVRDPVAWRARLRTAVLLLNGKADELVPARVSAERLARALRTGEHGRHNPHVPRREPRDQLAPAPLTPARLVLAAAGASRTGRVC